MFDLARVSASGLVAGIDYHESLGSTSDQALALATEGNIALPHLILAQRQTAGRGRGTNRWWTAEGALTFSLVVAAPPERLPPERWPQVALVAGLAVCEALQSLAPAAEFRVKWPNDVFLAGRKVCGILSESVPGWRDRLVVGIGINVNNALGKRGQGSGEGGQEEELGSIATALVNYDGLPRDLTSVLLAVLDQFDHRWGMFLSGGLTPLVEEYRQRCFLTGKTVTIQQPASQLLAGVCRGIDNRGFLLLRGETGEFTVSSGTVQRWE